MHLPGAHIFGPSAPITIAASSRSSKVPAASRTRAESALLAARANSDEQAILRQPELEHATSDVLGRPPIERDDAHA